MQMQNKGVIPVDPIIPWQGCSSAEPASASSDNNNIAKLQQEKKNRNNKLNRLLVEPSSDGSLIIDEDRTWASHRRM